MILNAQIFEFVLQAFIKNGETLSGRYPFAPLEALNKSHGVGSVDYGPKWKAQRKFGLMTLRG